MASLESIRLPGNQVTHKKTKHRIAEIDLPGRRIRTTHWTHKIIRANKIARINMIIRANDIDRTNKSIRTNQINRTTRSFGPIRSLQPRRSDGYLTVIERFHSSKSSTRSDGYLTVLKRLYSSKLSTRLDGQTLKSKSLTRKSRTFVRIIRLKRIIRFTRIAVLHTHT